MKPKSINSLMQYMRDTKGIRISGSAQKRKLRNMGYFHGYKGYRFCGEPTKLFPYSKFDELEAVYAFDLQLKGILYPQIMFVETALKNYALEVILNQSASESFADAFSIVLDDYKSYKNNLKVYKEATKKRLALRTKIYSNIARDYGKNFIVSHYYNKDEKVPIWAIFELLTLGEFGNLIQCMNLNARRSISKEIGFDQSKDADGRLLEQTVFLLKDLRNAVAHNNIVFDTRFKTHIVSERIKRYLSDETNIKDITFETIVDYVILLAFLMKKLELSKREIDAYINRFEQSYESFRKRVPTSIYSRVIHTNTRSKLTVLKQYL